MKAKVGRQIAWAAAAALASGGALAQQAGDWVFGTGWIHLAPQDSSTPLTFTAPRPAVLFGSGANVSSSDTLGFSAHYFFNSNWAVEGVVGVPPRFSLYGTGTLAPVGELGTARQWSPAIIGKYYFRDGGAEFRPYVGLGAAYVRYGSVSLTSGLQGSFDARLGRPPGSTITTASLDNSVVAVFNAGAAWQLDRNWGISFSVSYLPLKSTATLTTSAVGSGLPLARSQAGLKFNPITTYLSATYRY